MEFDELPTHIQEQWEQSEQFGDELRMIRTLRAGKHGELSWSKDKSEFAADAIEKIERHRKGFFHPHEAAAEISRLKPFEEAAERALLTKIVHHIKAGAIPIYREPLMFKETFTTGEKYSELEILLNASDLNEWLKSRNTDLQLMVPKQSAVTNLQLTAMQPLSTPQPAPASEPVMRQQEKKIMEWLKENGYRAESLPERVNGKGTVKALAKEALNGKDVFKGRTTFGKAWDRLRGGKEIQEKV